MQFSESILILLYSQPDHALFQQSRLVRELYIIVRKYTDAPCDDWSRFETKAVEALNALINMRLVVRVGVKRSLQEQFWLTDVGRDVAKALFNELMPSLQTILKSERKDLDQRLPKDLDYYIKARWGNVK